MHATNKIEQFFTPVCKGFDYNRYLTKQQDPPLPTPQIQTEKHKLDQQKHGGVSFASLKVFAGHWSQCPGDITPPYTPCESQHFNCVQYKVSVCFLSQYKCTKNYFINLSNVVCLLGTHYCFKGTFKQSIFSHSLLSL